MNPKPETLNHKALTLQSLNHKRQNENPETQILHPRPANRMASERPTEERNPLTLNPKPQIPNPKPANRMAYGRPTEVKHSLLQDGAMGATIALLHHEEDSTLCADLSFILYELGSSPKVETRSKALVLRSTFYIQNPTYHAPHHTTCAPQPLSS